MYRNAGVFVFVGTSQQTHASADTQRESVLVLYDVSSKIGNEWNIQTVWLFAAGAAAADAFRTEDQVEQQKKSLIISRKSTPFEMETERCCVIHDPFAQANASLAALAASAAHLFSSH